MPNLYKIYNRIWNSWPFLFFGGSAAAVFSVCVAITQIETMPASIRCTLVFAAIALYGLFGRLAQYAWEA